MSGMIPSAAGAILVLLVPTAILAADASQVPYTKVDLDRDYKRPEKPPGAGDAAVAYTASQIKPKGEVKSEDLQLEKVGDKWVAKFKEGKSLEVEAYLDKDQSWVERGADGKPTADAKSREDHEQRHLDIAKAAAKEATAEIKTYSGEGSTPNEAAQALADKITKKIQEKDADAAAEDTAYDTETKNGTDPDKQKEWDGKIDQKLKQENKNPKPDTPKAESKTTKSLTFDAADGILSLRDDVITAIDPQLSGLLPSGNDPILGAEVLLDDYRYLGAWNDRTAFFGPATDGALTLEGGGSTLLDGNVGYLFYDIPDNALYGIIGGYSGPADTSAFLDHLFGDLAGDPKALMYLSLFPEANLADLTQDFTVSGTTPATNEIGAGAIPEPATGLLVGMGALLCAGMRRRARRSPARAALRSALDPSSATPGHASR